jgi:hypothetical protein
MAHAPERRHGRRLVVPGRPGGRVRATVEARLLDLSPTGARIEHANLLRPGFTCVLELPPSLGALSLSVQVVRSNVTHAAEKESGERKLRYESGLAFLEMTRDQRASLESLLDRLAPGGEWSEGRLVL